LIGSSKDSVPAKFCFACAQGIDFSTEICPKCGVRQPLQKTQGKRSRLVAAIFAILLGSLGIHKFYLGQIGMGVLYLIFCWTFIPWIVGFIEGLIFLTMSDAEFAEKYG
jgi:TM2 domain-containing membrane protein YozV